ncbi:MAG: tRNA uridine-5-carboxymethylaminomethyl(34) synthesis GTPase MnmE [Maricaulaceae bacterium]
MNSVCAPDRDERLSRSLPSIDAGADTIVALASGSGRVGVAVIRLSGPAALDIGARLTRRVYLTPRRLERARLYHPETGEALDDGLAVSFPAPKSFTGEAVFEWQGHGGRAVGQAALDAFCAAGARLAAPGEFTRRAFEAGKLDLTQVEALADLVDAETEAQRRLALSHLSGTLSRRYAEWRRRLRDLLAVIAADIDFADEGDVPETVAQGVRSALTGLSRDIRTYLDDGHAGERIREGFRIALVGAPNAGKSSLFNALSQRDAAIVTPIAGTTRDVLEVRLDLGGHLVVLGDTAGLRESDDPVEQEGVRRARAWASAADLRLGVAATADDASGLTDAGVDLWVWSKSDLGGSSPVARGVGDADVVATSVVQVGGVEALRARLTDIVTDRLSRKSSDGLSHARHRDALNRAASHLERAADLVETGVDLAGEECRLAGRALAGLIGAVDVEDVLGAVFESFCIGK